MAYFLYFFGVKCSSWVNVSFRHVPVAPLGLIHEHKSYHISTHAVLGKAKVEALQKRDIDLMYYWEFKRPSMRTEKFTGRQFLQSGKAAAEEKK